MAEGEEELALKTIGVLDKLKRTTESRRHGHGKRPVVVVRKHVKGQSGLAQVVQALNAFGPGAALAKGRQEQRGEDSNDRYNAEQLQQSETVWLIWFHGGLKGLRGDWWPGRLA